MKVELREIYSHNLSGNYEINTRFFVLTNKGREVEIKYLANTFFPESNEEFQKRLSIGYSGRRSPEGYESEKDFISGKPVNLMKKGMGYTDRYFSLLNVYYYSEESIFSEVINTFTAEISPQALRVLIEPWKYGIDRRHYNKIKRGS